MLILRPPRTSQPQQSPSVNPAFPRPQLLHFGAFNSVIGPVPTNVSGATEATNAGGRGISHNGTNYLQFGAGFNSASFSVLVQFAVGSAASTITLTQSGFTGTTDGSQQFRMGTSGAMELIRDNQAVVIASATGAITAGRVHTALVSWDNTLGAGYIALDGRILVTASPGAQTWANDNFVAGRKRTLDTSESGAHVRTLLSRWNQPLSQGLGVSLTANPWQLFTPRARRFWVPAPAAGSYTLTADAGAFTLTGQDANLNVGRLLTADAGSFTLTGQAVDLEFGRVLTADAGSFTLTGQAVDLKAGRLLTADAGTFTLTGQDVGLTYTQTGAYTLTADTGQFTLSGQDVTLTYTALNAYTLTAETGSFSLSGQDVDLRYSAEPEAPPKRQGAGKSKRRRYTVEVDGEEFDVSSPAEADAVLAKVREQAEQTAAVALERAQAAEKRPTRKVLADARKALVLPDIKVPDEMQARVQATLESIEALYQSTLQTIEIAALLRKRQQEEEDDEDILLLIA